MGFPEDQIGQWNDAGGEKMLVWTWDDWLCWLEGGVGDDRYADASLTSALNTLTP